MVVNMKTKGAKDVPKKASKKPAKKPAKKPSAKKAPGTKKPKGKKPVGKQFMETEVQTSTPSPDAPGDASADTVIANEVTQQEIDPAVVTPNGGDPDAEVEFALGTIIPTGQFTNIRVHVGAKVRCEADLEVMDSTFDVVKGFVDNKITEVIAEIQGGG